jgi:hypothetical protein
LDEVCRSLNRFPRIHGLRVSCEDRRKFADLGGCASSIVKAGTAPSRATVDGVTLTDARDICTVVKGNAILNSTADLGESRFGREFETCANRTLHYEASLMQAGGIIGVNNILRNL